jgi:hypothetical protein
MQRMRHHVMDHNIYRWAASILGDLRELRMESSGSTAPIHVQLACPTPTEESNMQNATAISTAT